MTTNIKITQTPVDIETLITTVFGSVDNETTYQIQNTGGNIIFALTIVDNDEEKAQCNNIKELAYYKHKDNTVVKLFTNFFDTTVAITTLGE